MECEYCAYFWKEDYEDYPCCHWKSERCPGDIAPCEEEPYWEDDYDEIGYDPYLGCYSEDC